jgi:ech hydrogenase subunit A
MSGEDLPVELLLFLIAFPLLTALLMLITPNDTVRTWIVRLSALGIIAVTLLLLYTGYTKGAVYYPFATEPYGLLMFAIGLLIAVYLLYKGVRHKEYIALVLVLVQTAIMVLYEVQFSHGIEARYNLFFDEFSLIMAFIIGIIGSLIAVYALGYMKEFHHHHKNIRDRRNWFFFVTFAFLSGMFGLVFANNIVWVYFFWEVTTLCSFILLGYTETEEATKNAFLALNLNLLGGIAFVGAIIYLATLGGGIIGIDEILASGKAVALIPAVLIAFAGLTKSAQLPFSSWLLGAMVAPTPVSALLHSSTMVKAGVYIMVRLAPILAATLAGYMVALVGALTFLIASGIAISQSNAKRVLAYSTVANLGLVVACAGIGTYEAIWAAILLIIFHAIAKSLLFLAVGTVEHKIGSRDIEDMNGLIVRMPKTAAIMVIGMAGMFLAPFGMLISKWAAIRAFIDAPFGILFVFILAFGSALTVFFWAKWMGRLIAVTAPQENAEKSVDVNEWWVLLALAGLTFVACFIFPLISKTLIEPFLLSTYGTVAQLSQDNILIMILMMVLIIVLPISMLVTKKDVKTLPPYMAGMTATPDLRFTGALGIERKSAMANDYLEPYFGEFRLHRAGIVLCSAVIVIMFIALGLRGVIL